MGQLIIMSILLGLTRRIIKIQSTTEGARGAMWLSHMVSEPWQAALVNVTKVPLTTERWMLEFVILGLITAGHSDLTTFTK